MTVNMYERLFVRRQGMWGYISKDLFLRLMARGLKIITELKRNIKNHFDVILGENPSAQTLSRQDGF